MSHAVMPSYRCCFLALLFWASFAVPGAAAEPDGPRSTVRLDDWRFAPGHASDRARDFGHGTGYFSYLAKTGFGDGPASPSFDDCAWRRITVPHDWAVEAPFSPEASPSHGFKAIGPGFPERSVGWYRTSLFVPESDLGRRIALEFEGIYRDANIFVNGFFVDNQRVPGLRRRECRCRAGGCLEGGGLVLRGGRHLPTGPPAHPRTAPRSAARGLGPFDDPSTRRAPSPWRSAVVGAVFRRSWTPPGSTTSARAIPTANTPTSPGR